MDDFFRGYVTTFLGYFHEILRVVLYSHDYCLYNLKITITHDFDSENYKNTAILLFYLCFDSF